MCGIEILTPPHVSDFNLGSHDGLKKAVSILRSFLHMGSVVGANKKMSFSAERDGYGREARRKRNVKRADWWAIRRLL